MSWLAELQPGDDVLIDVSRVEIGERYQRGRVYRVLKTQIELETGEKYLISSGKRTPWKWDLQAPRLLQATSEAVAHAEAAERERREAEDRSALHFSLSNCDWRKVPSEYGKQALEIYRNARAAVEAEA